MNKFTEGEAIWYNYKIGTVKKIKAENLFGNAAFYYDVEVFDDKKGLVLYKHIPEDVLRLEGAPKTENQKIKKRGAEINSIIETKVKNMVGLKYDGAKPDYTLVTKELMDAVSRAMGYGAKKYERDNFKLFTKADEKRFEAALLRHMVAYTSGELNDPESGLTHLDHVGSTLNILLWIRGNK